MLLVMYLQLKFEFILTYNIAVLFSHGSNKAFLVPDSCRATKRNGNSADVTDDATEND